MIEIDAGPISIDAGSIEIDSSLIEIDAGSIEIDGGLIEIADGSIEIDDELIEIDDGSIEIDDELIEIDAGPIEETSSPTRPEAKGGRTDDEATNTKEEPLNQLSNRIEVIVAVTLIEGEVS